MLKKQLIIVIKSTCQIFMHKIVKEKVEGTGSKIGENNIEEGWLEDK